MKYIQKGNTSMQDVILIPAYKPDKAMLQLVDELAENKFDILIVDDGSGEAFAPLFEQAARKATVLHHDVNRGKGAALKTGIAAIRELFPECRHFITADADGQHSVNDIKRVNAELEGGAGFVLTMRRLNKNVPFRSKFGNILSRVVYTLLTQHYLDDNQSGLRGFSIDQADWLLQVSGERYDYEMNMLLFADKQHITFTTMYIDTIYINDNASSHFNPVKDTIRIYKRLFGTAWATFVGWAVVLDMVLMFTLILGRHGIWWSIPSAGVAYAFVNIIFERFIVFRRVKYADAPRTLIHTLFRFIVYTALSAALCFTLNIPLIISFIISVIISMPFDYFLHKLANFAKYKEINRT